MFVSISNDGPTNALKEVNNLFHPMGATDYNKAEELNFEMQIGTKRYPEYAIRSLAEAL